MSSRSRLCTASSGWLRWPGSIACAHSNGTLGFKDLEFWGLAKVFKEEKVGEENRETLRVQ